MSYELWKIVEEGYKPANPDDLTPSKAYDKELNSTALMMIRKGTVPQHEHHQATMGCSCVNQDRRHHTLTNKI